LATKPAGNEAGRKQGIEGKALNHYCKQLTEHMTQRKNQSTNNGLTYLVGSQ
jgi:hypothetical protein